MSQAPSHHNVSVWIMALGITFSLGLFATAVFNKSPWLDHSYNQASPIVAGTAAPHRDGRENMVCSTCHIVVPPKMAAGPTSTALPVVQGTPAPHVDGREKMACASCHTMVPKGSIPETRAQLPIPQSPPPASLPQAVSVAMTAIPAPALNPEAHEWMVPFRYQGRVSAVGGSGSRSTWGEVYVQVDDGINPPYWIDLAPRWFLRAAGCAVSPGLFVKGTAFRDPTQASSVLAYGKTLMTNGEVCGLRDNHLEGLWAEAGGTDAEER